MYIYFLFVLLYVGCAPEPATMDELNGYEETIELLKKEKEELEKEIEKYHSEVNEVLQKKKQTGQNSHGIMRLVVPRY